MPETSGNLESFRLGKRFVGHSAVYGVARIAQTLASIILLPVYTHYLTPKDYGVIELLSMLVEFSAIFFGARVGASFLRYYGLAEEDGRRSRVLGSAYGTVAGIHLIGVSVLVVGAALLSRLVLGDEQYADLVALFAISLLFASLTEIPMAYLRAESKPFHVLGFSLFKLCVQISFTLLFLVYLNKGVYGVAIASVLSQFVVALFVSVYVMRQRRFLFSFQLMKELLSFSMPIIISSVCMFIITYGDRYFIRLNVDLDAVGIYALAYKFGFMLFALGWSPFLTMWDAERYKLYKNEDQHSLYPKIFAMVSVLFIYVAFGISIWVDPVLQVMSDSSFWSAADLVPIILLAYVFLAFTSFVNLGIFISAQTRFLGIISALTALLALAGYAFFIPPFGLYGAAWVTVFAFLIRFLGIYFVSKGYFDMKIRWYPTVMALVLAIALVCVKVFIVTILPPVLVALLLSLAFPILVFVLRIFSIRKFIETARWVVRKPGA